MNYLEVSRKGHIVHQWEKKRSPTALNNVNVPLKKCYHILSFEVHFLISFKHQEG
jgi:hypothetical protein